MRKYRRRSLPAVGLEDWRWDYSLRAQSGERAKKWFQVTRFPALPTAGIHGVEHLNWKRRTLRLSAPQPPVSPTTVSKPQSAPQPIFHSGPVARNGLSLTRNGSRFHELHSGVKGPGLLLRFLARRFPRPFGLNLHNRPRFAPVPAASTAHARCAACDSRA